MGDIPPALGIAPAVVGPSVAANPPGADAPPVVAGAADDGPSAGDTTVEVAASSEVAGSPEVAGIRGGAEPPSIAVAAGAPSAWAASPVPEGDGDATWSASPPAASPPASPHASPPASPHAALAPAWAPPAGPPLVAWPADPHDPGATARRAPRQVAVLAIAVVAALVVAAAGVSSLVGADGGADSPEGAVTELVEAIAAEDPIAAIAMLNPDEVRMLADVLDIAQDRVADLGLVDAADPYAGLDLRIDDLELDVEELADGLAKVWIDSIEVEAELDPDEIDDDVRDRLEEASGGELDADEASFDEDDLEATDEDGDGVDPFLMTVRRDGGWYVSPMFTVAEYVAELTDSDPDYTPVDELGEPGETPTAAVEGLVLAAADLDLDAALGYLPADELAPLHVYRDVIEDAIADELDADGLDRDDIEVDLQLEGVETSEQDLGDGLTRVTVDAFEATATADIDGDESEVEVRWDGECIEWRTVETDEDGDVDDDEGEDCVDADELGAFGLDGFFVVTAEERGGHVVSPVATLLEYARVVLEGMDDTVWQVAIEGPLGLDPAGTVELGEPFDTPLTASGYARLQVELEAGELYTVEVDGPEADEYGYWVQLYEPDGDELWVDRVVQPDESGTFDLVVDGEPFGGTGDEVTVTVAAVSVRDVALPAVLTDAVEPGDVVGYRFDLDEPGAVVLSAGLGLAELDPDDVDVFEFVDEDGDPAYAYPGEVTNLDDGTWTLIVRAAAAFPDGLGVLAVLPPLGFEGGEAATTVDVVAGTSTVVGFTVPAPGEVYLTAYADEWSAEVRLVLFDPTLAVVDEEVDESGAWFEFDADVPGQWYVEVSTDVDTEVELYVESY